MKKKLKEKRATKIAELEKLNERAGEWTDEEKRTVEKLKAQIAEINEAIKSAEEIEDEIRNEVREESTNEQRGGQPAQNNGGAGKPTPAKNDPGSQQTVPATPASGNQRNRFPEFGTFGAFLCAVAERANPNLGWDKKKELDERFQRYQRAVADEGERRSVTTGGNTLAGDEGGFLVEQEVANSIWSRSVEQATFAPLCSSWTLGSNANSLKIPALVDNNRTTGNRLGGVMVYWAEEGDTVPPSNIKLRTIQVDLNKLMGFWYATDEVLSDAPLMESIARKGFEDEIAWTVDNAIINEDGIGKPLGIRNSGALITVNSTGGALAPVDITKVAARVKPSSWRSPSFRWVMNPDTNAELPLMTFSVGTGGVPVYMPPGGLSVAPYGTLLGKEVLVNEFSPANKAAGDLMAIDFKEYLLLKKGGVNWDQSMHVQFLYDQHVFRIKLRIGGMPMWDAPVTAANTSTTTSPFVALGTRT